MKKKNCFTKSNCVSFLIDFGGRFSRYIIETKPPLLNSAVADLVEGPLFRVNEIAEGRQASTSPFPLPPLGQGLGTPLFSRGIEGSLRALSSIRAVRLFLRTRAVIKCVLRAASTLEITDGEQRALRKFSRRNVDLSLLGFAPSHLADTIQPISAVYSQLCLQCDTLGGCSKRSKAFFLI